mgnify:CR=1 FL=1
MAAANAVWTGHIRFGLVSLPIRVYTASNSSGGVMGKMIDAQSIVVATAGVVLVAAKPGLKLEGGGMSRAFDRRRRMSEGVRDRWIISYADFVTLLFAFLPLLAQGAVLLVLEAMKMEHALTAPFDGTVAELAVSEGQQVQVEALLAKVEKAEG